MNSMQMGFQKIKGKDHLESKKGRRRQKRSLPVQVLYDTCKEVFANCGPGIVPSPENIERLKAVLGTRICFF